MATNCVLFDLDGTLLDTAPDFIFILNAMRAEQSLSTLEPSTIRNSVSGGAREMVKIALGGNKGEPEFEQNVARFLDRYNQKTTNHESHSCLFNGMAELITAIEGKKIPWGIVTNKIERYAAPLINQLQINHA